MNREDVEASPRRNNNAGSDPLVPHHRSTAFFNVPYYESNDRLEAVWKDRKYEMRKRPPMGTGARNSMVFVTEQPSLIINESKTKQGLKLNESSQVLYGGLSLG
jgi:hypothetical protein